MAYDPRAAILAVIIMALLVVIIPVIYAVLPTDWGGPSWLNNFTYIFLPVMGVLSILLALFVSARR